MGGAISQIEIIPSTTSKCIETLRRLSLNEVINFYSAVRTHTDRMTVSFSEFSEIFGLGLEDFNLWDTEQRNLVSVFEFLTGVVLIGRMDFGTRVKCLFDLFDFNSVGRICSDELRLLVTVALEASAKLREVALVVRDVEVEDFTRRIIDRRRDVSVGRLEYLLRKDQWVVRLFLVLGHQSHLPPSTTKEERLHMLQDPSSKITHTIKDYPKHRTEKNSRCSAILGSSTERQRSLALVSLMEEVARGQVFEVRTADLQTKWAFGFDPSCSLSPLVLSRVPGETKELMYLLEKLVVVYNPKKRSQRLFTRHKENVTVVTVSSDGETVASAGGNRHPEVLLWDKKTIMVEHALTIPSITSVYLLSFIDSNRRLVILTKKPNPGLYIYDLTARTTVYSSTVSDFVLRICPFVSLLPFPGTNEANTVCYVGNDLSKSVFLVGNHLFTYLLWNVDRGEYSQSFVNPLADLCGQTTREHLKDGVVLFRHVLDTKGLLFAQKSEFHLEIWTVTDQGTLLRTRSEILSKKIIFGTQIVRLGVGINSFSCIAFVVTDVLALLTPSQELLLVSLSSHSVVSRVDLKVQLRDFGNDLVVERVLSYSHNKLLLLGSRGEVFRLRVRGQPRAEEHKPVHWFEQIFLISRNSNQMSLTSEVGGDLRLYIYGGEDSITIVSMDTKRVIERVVLGDEVTCLDVQSSHNQPTMMAVGTADGTVRVRLDHVFLPKFFRYPFSPTLLRFSSSGTHLLCCTAEASLLLFTLSDGNYFYDVPKISLEDEEVLWMSFSSTDEEIYFGTNCQKTYLVKVSEFRERKLRVVSLAEVPVSRTMHLRLGTDTLSASNPCLVFPCSGLLVRADDSGALLLFPSFKSLLEDACTLKYLHGSKTTAMIADADGKRVFTLARGNGSLLYHSLVVDRVVSHESRSGRELKMLTDSIGRNLIGCSVPRILVNDLRDSLACIHGLSSGYLQSIFGVKGQEGRGGCSNEEVRSPRVHLELLNVYGFTSSVFRGSVLYLHHDVSKRREEPTGEEKVDQETLLKISNFSENLKIRKMSQETRSARLDVANTKRFTFFSQHFGTSLSLDDLSSTNQCLMDCRLPGKDCCRKVIYFISRVVVIIDSPHLDNPAQRFYQRHSGEVTALAVDPGYRLAASGENGLRPAIHVWEVATCNTLRIVRTAHHLGIIQLKFSVKGDLVFSTAADLHSSIQVTDIATGDERAFRNTSTSRVFELVASPRDNLSFVTVKASRLDVWRVEASSLVNEWFIDVSSIAQGSCMVSARYLSYQTSKEIIDDILLMTSDCRLFVVRDRLVIHSVNLNEGRKVIEGGMSQSELGHLRMQQYLENFGKKMEVDEVTEEENESDSLEFSNCLSDQSDFEDQLQPKLSFVRRSTLKISTQKPDSRSDFSDNLSSNPQSVTENDHALPFSNSSSTPTASQMRHFLLFDTFYLAVVTEGGHLLIYSTSFALEFKAHLDEVLVDPKNSKIENPKKPNEPTQFPTVQSIDVYLSDQEVFFILSVTTGSLLELSVRYTLLPLRHSQKSRVTFSLGGHRELCRFHTSPSFTLSTNPFDFRFNRRVHLATSSVFSVFATAGDDGELFLHDFEKRSVVARVTLGERPSAIKFSPDGKMLVVGFLSGHTSIFELTVGVRTVSGVQQHSFALGQPLQTITPDWMFDPESPPRSVLAIEFCSAGDLMAVSYDNAKEIPSSGHQDSINRPSPPTISKDSPSSVVIIYVSRDSLRREEYEGTGNDDLYTPYTEVRLASLYYADTSKMSLLGMAVHFLLFSENGNYLMLYYQNTNQYRCREHKDRDGKYVIWNFKSKSAEINPETLRSIKFNGINFPTHIIVKERALGSNKVAELVDLTEEPETSNKYVSSVMLQGDLLFMGAVDGDLLVADVKALSQSADVTLDRPSRRGKMLAGHSSPVTQLEMSVNASYMFTVSESDECVLQWKVVGLSDHQRSDTQCQANEETLRPDREVYPTTPTFQHITASQLDRLIFETLPSRQQSLSLKEHTSPLIFPKFSLSLKQILGRKHPTYSNHLRSFGRNEFCYFAGTHVVISRLHSRDNLPTLLNEERTLVHSSGQNGTENDQAGLSLKPQLRAVVNNRRAVNQSVVSPDLSTFVQYHKSIVAGDKDSDSSVFMSQRLFDCSFDSYIASSNYSDRSFSRSSEVGAIEVTSDGELLYALTNDIYSRVSVWKVSTSSLVRWSVVQHCVIPLMVRLSEAGTSVVILGLNNQKIPCLFFLLADLSLLSVVFLEGNDRFFINDLSFVMGRHCAFVTVGRSHASLWTSKGSLLQEQTMRVALEEEGEDQSDRNFLLVRFIKSELYLTTSFDGGLQLWYDGQLKESKAIFSDCPLSAVTQCPKDPMEILVGGHAPRLELLQILQKDSLFTLVSIYSIDLMVFGAFRPIESILVINRRYLVVGQADGSCATVYFNFEDFEKEKRARRNINQLTYYEKQERLSTQRRVFPLMYLFDDDVPLVADFSADTNSLYLIGQNGSFVILDVETLLPLYHYRFERKTLDLVNLHDGVLLVFEDSLLILKVRDSVVVVDEETTRLVTKASRISKVRFHRTSGFLAIGFEGFLDQPSIIEIFRTGEVFEKFHTLETEELLLLDFSSENEERLYLMYSDVVGRTEVFRIEHDQVVVESRNDILWSTDGFLVSTECSDLFTHGLQWSDVVSVFLIDSETLVLLDKEGTVG